MREKKTVFSTKVVIGIIAILAITGCSLEPFEPGSKGPQKKISELADTGNAAFKTVQGKAHPVAYNSKTLSGVNIGINKPAYASSYYSVAYLPSKAVDGNTGTLWASQTNSNGEWIYLDLLNLKNITDIAIKWYDMYFAIQYQVCISADGTLWESVTSITDGDGGNDVININTTCRYIKIHCNQANAFAYAIAELEVYSQKQYRVAVIDSYNYSTERMNLRLIETDGNTDYTTENGGVLYTATSCQGIQGGFFENNCLFFTYDDTDETANDYLFKINYTGTIQQTITLGSGIAPQEMLRADNGLIYLSFQYQWLTNGGLKQINDSVSTVTDYTTNGLGAHYLAKLGGNIYLSHYGDWGADYAGARVEVYNPSNMALLNTINLTDNISTKCQNTRNVCYFGNCLYIACYDDYFAPGAIVKVDSSYNTQAINLNNYSPVRIIATTNKVYVGAESITNWDNIVEAVFEVDTTGNSVNENNPLAVSGYRIYDFKSFDNKIFATAVKNSRHYVLVADEFFNLEKEIEIYTNERFPLLLAMESYY